MNFDVELARCLAYVAVDQKIEQTLPAKHAQHQGSEARFKLHDDLAQQHYEHAVTHATRIGRGKHDVAALQGAMVEAMDQRDYDPSQETNVITRFRPHKHDSALGGRVLDPKKVTKSDAFLQDLAKAMRRRPSSIQRALGRKRKTKGVWSHSRKGKTKLKPAQIAARKEAQVQSSGHRQGGIMAAISGLFGS